MEKVADSLDVAKFAITHIALAQASIVVKMKDHTETK